MTEFAHAAKPHRADGHEVGGRGSEALFAVDAQTSGTYSKALAWGGAGAPSPPPLTPMGVMSVQRRCACGGDAGPGGECEECAARRLARQRVGAGGAGPEPARVPPVVHEALRGPGAPLDGATRSFMEPRFGHDFGDVRVYSGPLASRAAGAVSASAFTVGQNIAFGAGRYAPHTPAGRALLAHELAHTVQQRRSSPPPSPDGALAISSPGDPAEREADAAAHSVLSGGAVQALSSTGRAIHRGTGDPPGGGLRSSGLTEAEWAKIRETRRFFNLPDRPTASKPTIVGVLITPEGEEVPLKSGEHGGPAGGTQRGGIPRGPGEGFTGGGPHQGNIATHVEGHAAAVMHQRKLTEATLLIEEAPCLGACDRTGGWDASKGDWTNPKPVRGAPQISTALPPGAKLTIVDPGATGHYRSTSPAPLVPRVPPPEGPAGAGRTLNTPPKPLPQEKLPAVPRSGGVLPEKITTPGLAPRPPAAAGAAAEGVAGGVARKGGMGPRVLAGLGNIAFDLAILTAMVVWELVVVPKIRELQSELEKFLFELEEKRRKQLEKQIQDKFTAFEAAHVGRIVKWCYLKQLRALEQAGKKGYINISIKVSFEDTSGRFQLFKETPPESYFDLEFYDVDLASAVVSETPAPESTGPLGRCDSCGALGRSRSFMGNNPLWEQTVVFSVEAPKADEIAKEFEKEPEIADCVGAIACWIATVCYGSPFTPQVRLLREFRDVALRRHPLGRLFIDLYYRTSPPVADFLSRHAIARSLVRYAVVAPVVALVRAQAGRWRGLASTEAASSPAS